MTRIKQIWRMLWHKLYDLWRRIRRKPKIYYYDGTLKAADIAADTITSSDIKKEMHYPLGGGTYTDRDVRRLADMITGLPVYTDDELLEFVDRHLSPAAREWAAKGRKK